MELMLSLVGSLWSHVGPGLILALALPASLALFGVILLVGYRRLKGEPS